MEFGSRSTISVLFGIRRQELRWNVIRGDEIRPPQQISSCVLPNADFLEIQDEVGLPTLRIGISRSEVQDLAGIAKLSWVGESASSRLRCPPSAPYLEAFTLRHTRACLKRGQKVHELGVASVRNEQNYLPQLQNTTTEAKDKQIFGMYPSNDFKLKPFS